MPRAATPLTDSAIKAAKPKEKPYKLTDGQGLYLEITPNGSKLWRLKYRHADKEKRLAFGAYPAVPLQKARQRREPEALHPAARTFQALRILVNDELGGLDRLLHALPYCLRPGGRAAVLSFHSGEDRRVKHAFRAGLDAGLYDAVADEVVRASPAEVASNPRAAPAKLRWARRAR